MTETPHTRAQLDTLLATNHNRELSAVKLLDFVASVMPDTGYFKRTIDGNGAPTDGVTGAGTSEPGAFYIDLTAGSAYVNKGTKVSPVWQAGGGSTDFTAIASDVKPSVDDTYSIGSASKRWLEGWIGGLHLDPSGGSPIISVISGANGSATFQVLGLGAQLSIAAADGDDDHTGGELDIASGKGSANSSGGDIQIIPGNASGGGDGGNMTVQSGATTGVGAGDAGELSVHAGNSTDGAGGVLALAGGDSTDWHGGNVTIQAGQSANSTNGKVSIYEGGFNYGIEIQPTHIYFAQASPPTVPATPTAQDIVDALVTLGLIAQSP